MGPREGIRGLHGEQGMCLKFMSKIHVGSSLFSRINYQQMLSLQIQQVDSLFRGLVRMR